MSIKDLTLQLTIGTPNPSVTLPIINSPHCHKQHIPTFTHTNPRTHLQPPKIHPSNTHNINASNPLHHQSQINTNIPLFGNEHEPIPSTTSPTYAPTISNQHITTHHITHSHTDVYQTTPPNTCIQPPPSQHNTTIPPVMHVMTRIPRPLPSQGNGRGIHSTPDKIPLQHTIHPSIYTTDKNQYETLLPTSTTHDNNDSAYPPSLLHKCNNDGGTTKLVHPHDTNHNKQTDDDDNTSPRHTHECHNPSNPPIIIRTSRY